MLVGAGHEIDCPVCVGHTEKVWATSAHLRLRHCPECGHDFLEPPSANEVKAAYGHHYVGFRGDPVFARSVREQLRRALVPLVPPPADLLDVGCGAGEFLAAASEVNYNVVGFDLSEAAVELASSRGFEAISGDLLSHPFEDSSFDIVTMWDVMEHLPQPRIFARVVHRILRPGGVLLVKSPLVTRRSIAIASFVPRLAGPLLQIPSHIQFFRRDTLAALLKGAGFESLVWFPAVAMRGKRMDGGILKRGKRWVTGVLHLVAGDGNLLVGARK